MNEMSDFWMKKPKRVMAIEEATGKTVILSEERKLPKGLKIKEERSKQWKTNNKRSN